MLAGRACAAAQQAALKLWPWQARVIFYSNICSACTAARYASLLISIISYGQRRLDEVLPSGDLPAPWQRAGQWAWPPSGSAPSGLQPTESAGLVVISYQQVAVQPSGVGAVAQHGPFSVQSLVAAAPGVQHQLFGERLCPVIQRILPERAGTHMGVMLDMNNRNLMALLKS